MFKAHQSVYTTRLNKPTLSKSRKVRNSSITFSDSTGPVLTIFGIGALTRGGARGYVATLFKVSADEYKLRLFDPSQSVLATYIGSASSRGSGDTISGLQTAISGSPYLRSVFHKETSEAISASLGYSDGTAFTNGRG